MTDRELIDQLRAALPRLLREHPEVRHELWGLMLEAFPSRQEFLELLQEIRALRVDMDRRFEELRVAMDRRFEAMDRRFEAVDRRFEAVLASLRSLQLEVSALGGRVGRGLEHLVRAVVEEFAGQTFPVAERLVLTDQAGEVYGVPGASVEFDLYAHNGSAYLVEVKSHVKPSDVLLFHRKAQFAMERLGRPATKLMLALSMEAEAEVLLRQLGIEHRIRSVMS
jgi:hypothetical protein